MIMVGLSAKSAVKTFLRLKAPTVFESHHKWRAGLFDLFDSNSRKVDQNRSNQGSFSIITLACAVKDCTKVAQKPRPLSFFGELAAIVCVCTKQDNRSWTK